MAMATVAACVPALQPILLNGLLAEGRIDSAAIGYAATAEGLGMALASAVSGAWSPTRRLRALCAAGVLTVLVANLLTILLPAPGIVAARGLSGLGNGLLLWVFVGLSSRLSAPTRLFAIYITANSVLVFLLSLFLVTFAIGRFGVMSGYATLIALYGVLLLAVRLAPGDFVDLDGSGRRTTVPPLWGFVGLAAILLHMAGILGFWTYSIPLGTQSGVATAAMQMIISGATGVQIVAGLVAIVAANRLTGIQAVTISIAVELLAVLATLLGGGIHSWLPAMVALSFFWLFCPPFYMSFLIAADPTRRAAMFVGTSQLLGIALGPLLTSLVTSPANYSPARWVSVACFATALAVVAAVNRHRGKGHQGMVRPR